MKYKLYYIIGISVIVIIAVITAIVLTSRGKGSVIDIAIPSKGNIFRRTSNVILGPQTSQNLYYHKSGWFIKKIEFRLPEHSEGDYEIKALVTKKGEDPKVEDWTGIGKKTFCLDKRDERLKDLVLTINNVSTSTNFKGDVQVFAMEEGCDQWSGIVKYQWEDKGEKSIDRGILQATFTLKENAYATEFVVADGGYTFSRLGCEQEKPTKTFTMMGDGALSINTIRLVPQDDGRYKLKLPLKWGETDSATEYIKRKNICIYGKEPGDTVNNLDAQPIKTLDEIIAESLILDPDPITGNLKGEREINKTLEDGIERKITVSWDLSRQ